MIYPTRENASLFRGQKIGLLGGSFNPAHAGHMEISAYALEKLGLNAVWWLVTPQNPLKAPQTMAPFAQRVANARAIAQPNPQIVVTDLEQSLGTTHTAETLRLLTNLFTNSQFIWLMGMDNLTQLSRWHEGEELFHLVRIAVFRRSGYDCETEVEDSVYPRFAEHRLQAKDAQNLIASPLPAWVVLDNPLNPLSATEIRKNEAQFLCDQD